MIRGFWWGRFGEPIRKVNRGAMQIQKLPLKETLSETSQRNKNYFAKLERKRRERLDKEGWLYEGRGVAPPTFERGIQHIKRTDLPSATPPRLRPGQFKIFHVGDTVAYWGLPETFLCHTSLAMQIPYDYYAFENAS